MKHLAVSSYENIMVIEDLNIDYHDRDKDKNSYLVSLTLSDYLIR